MDCNTKSICAHGKFTAMTFYGCLSCKEVDAEN